MELATQLIDARRRRQTIERPSRYADDFDLERGYEVYAAVDKGLREKGFKPAGRKLGFTNKATWDEFELATPIWAYVYDQTLCLTGASEFEVKVSDLVAPRIEPEVVLKVGSRISNAGSDPNTLVDAIEWVAIGFEIVDCHFAEWRFTAAEIVADFGAHSRLVVGKPTMIDEGLKNDLSSRLEALSVNLLCNSALVETGVGRNALGGPLKALGFLITALDTHSWADKVQPGEVITTGTLTGLPYIHAGEQWTVEVSGFDLASLSITLV